MQKSKTQLSLEEGQGLVEFALILGVFLFLFLIMIEAFGLYRQRYGLDQVAREGARLAAEYGGNAPEVERYVLQQLENLLLDTTEVKVAVTAHEFTGTEIVPVSPPRSTCAYGEFVAVTVSAPWRVSIPGGGLFVQMITGDGIHRAEHLDKCWRSGEA
jgi:Flp pilus assembly protein TadG